MKVYTLRVLTYTLSLLYSAGQIIASPTTPTRACGNAFSMVSGFPFTPSTTDLPNAIAFSQLFLATADYPNGYFFAATSNTASVAGGPGNTISIYFVDAVTGKFTPAVGSPFSLASVVDPTTGAATQPTRGIGAPTPTSITFGPVVSGVLYAGFIQELPPTANSSGAMSTFFTVDIITGNALLPTFPSVVSGTSGLTFSAPVTLFTGLPDYQTASNFDTSLFLASVGPGQKSQGDVYIGPTTGNGSFIGSIDVSVNQPGDGLGGQEAPTGTTTSSVSFAPLLNNQLFFAQANVSSTQAGSVTIGAFDYLLVGAQPVPGSPFTLPGVTHLSSITVLPVVTVNTFYLAAVNTDSATTSSIYLYSFDTATNKITPIGSPISAGAPGTITFSPAGICPFIAAMQSPNASPLAGTINAFIINPFTATLSPLAGSPFDSGGTLLGPVAFSPLLPNNALFAATVNLNTGSTPNIALFKTIASSSVSLSANPATLTKGQSGTLTANLTGSGPFTLTISASTTPSTLTQFLYGGSQAGTQPNTIPLTPTITPTTEILTFSGSGPTINIPITPSATTQYQVISYTDSSGCTTCGPSDPVTVAVDPITKVELTNISSCKIGSASFAVNIIGGVPPFTITPYESIGGMGILDLFIFPSLVSDSPSGSYTVNFPSDIIGAGQAVSGAPGVVLLRVTDATGNQAISNYDPNGKQLTLAVSITPANVSVPQGQSFTLTAHVSQNGTFAPSFKWSGPDGFTSNASSITIDNAQTANAGTYTVNVSATDNDSIGSVSCTGTASAEVTVTSVPSGTITATSQRVCIGQTFSLTASIPGATSYAWTGPDGFTASTETITITNAQLVNGGMYSVTATVGDSKVTASIVIDVGLFPNIVTGYQSALSKAIQAKYCS